MFLINANRKVAVCPDCDHNIMQSDGYRYFLGKLLHDSCYSSFVQKWKQKQSQVKYLHKD